MTNKAYFINPIFLFTNFIVQVLPSESITTITENFLPPVYGLLLYRTIVCNDFCFFDTFRKKCSGTAYGCEEYRAISYNCICYFLFSSSFSNHSGKSQVKQSRCIFIHTTGCCCRACGTNRTSLSCRVGPI